jgi:hypothetical protein
VLCHLSHSTSPRAGLEFLFLVSTPLQLSVPFPSLGNWLRKQWSLRCIVCIRRLVWNHR